MAKMSHEIRTPLNAITGMAHLIRRESLSPLQSERLAKLVLAGEHLLGVINDILDMSKIDADKLELEAVPLQLESVLSQVLAMVDARALEKKIELVCEIPDLALQVVVGLSDLLLGGPALEIGRQHLGQRLDQGAFLLEERSLERRGPVFQINDLDPPFGAVAGTYF